MNPEHTEEQYYSYLMELLTATDAALKEYRELEAEINTQIERQINYEKRTFGQKPQTGDYLVNRLRDLEADKDSRLRVISERCFNKVHQAQQLALRHGVTQEDVTKCFDINNSPIDPAIKINQKEFDNHFKKLSKD